jgi:transcriptional regulator with XRE-family HTH domain
MERAGQKLKRIRERLKLTYRDVEECSQEIARRMNNSEFSIALSRLADIENKGTVPTIYRLYSLCAIYGQEYEDVLGWYGASLDGLASESLRSELAATRLLHFKPRGALAMPGPADVEIALEKTTFLSHVLRNWGALPLTLLKNMDLRRYRYGLIGLEDRSMYPLLRPGSLVLIDDRARIASSGWAHEYDRPIYFLEHRDGYICGWCDLQGERLVVLPHPASGAKPSVFRYGSEVDMVGQVIGAATLFIPPERQRGTQSSAVAAAPQSL